MVSILHHSLTVIALSNLQGAHHSLTAIALHLQGAWRASYPLVDVVLTLNVILVTRF